MKIYAFILLHIFIQTVKTEYVWNGTEWKWQDSDQTSTVIPATVAEDQTPFTDDDDDDAGSDGSGDGAGEFVPSLPVNNNNNNNHDADITYRNKREDDDDWSGDGSGEFVPPLPVNNNNDAGKKRVDDDQFYFQ